MPSTVGLAAALHTITSILPYFCKPRRFRQQFHNAQMMLLRLFINCKFDKFSPQDPTSVIPNFSWSWQQSRKQVNFTSTVFLIRSFLCCAFDTWQTNPRTSIPFALSFSTASSTFLSKTSHRLIIYEGKQKWKQTTKSVIRSKLELTKPDLNCNRIIGAISGKLARAHSTCRREEITTAAHSNPRRSAMARPMPWVEAVTIATLPSNLFAIFISMTTEIQALKFPTTASAFNCIEESIFLQNRDCGWRCCLYWCHWLSSASDTQNTPWY